MTERDRVYATYMSGPLDGKTLSWELPHDADELILTIGRREGCDILLDYDSQVSRLHARVIYNLPTDTFYLEDAGSRNGTFLGNERLTQRIHLLPGTLFRVGRTWLRIDPPRESTTDEYDDLPF
jgi:pSer/pThr/pTyr-binding forkhead associated (FHA) protein